MVAWTKGVGVEGVRSGCVRVESRAEVGNKTYTWGSSVIQINIKHRMRSPREGVQIESKV